MSNALRLLVSDYRRALFGSVADGRAFGLTSECEQLAAAIASRPGLHPIAQTRQLLIETLRVYGCSAADRRRKVDVVRLVWGLDGHPLSVERACEACGIAAKAKTAQRWGTQVCRETSVLELLRGLANEPSAGPRTWSLIDPAGPLPPAMLSAVATQLAPPHRWAELQDLITASVYDVASMLVERWYRGGHALEHTHHLDFFRVYSFDAWHRRFDPLPAGAPSPGTQKPTGGEYRGAMLATWTLCVSHALEQRADLARRFGMRLTLRADRSTDLERRWSLPTRRTLVVPRPTWSARSADASIENLERLAQASHSLAGSRASAFGSIVTDYLASRARVLAASRFIEDRERIALADHAIHWDTVVSEDRTLEERVRKESIARPTGVKLGYYTHLWRGRAILANKGSDWAAGAAFALTGVRELRKLWDDGRINDRIEYLGSSEQLWLALAGNCIRQIEWSLSHGSKAPGFLEGWCRTALVASRLALASLEELDGTLALEPNKGHGLPSTRGQDGRIDNRTWWARALIVRLRVGLAVHTAVHSRLVSKRALHQDGASVLPKEDLDLLAVGSLSQLFEAICTLDTLTRDHQQEVVTLGAWLALIRGGDLPPVRPASSDFARGVEFLVDDPGKGLSFEPLVEWLGQGVPSDALVLSWIPPKLPAYRYLDGVGGYADFRGLHDPHRPTTPSHD